MEKQLYMDEKMDVGGIPDSKKGGVNPKVFLIGLPLFILQLIVVYFVTANILLSKMQPNGHAAVPADSAHTGAAAEVKEEPAELSTFNLDDIIVNPTGTNGQRLLLASVSFELPSKENLEVIEKKKEVVTDIVITSLSSKTVDQLNSFTFKDTLKSEISKSIVKKFPKVKIRNIYFPKFIIQ